MKLEDRIEILEAAHRSLVARNEALFQICKITLPIALASNPDNARRAATSCYDATNEHMDSNAWDADMQEMVREALDELSEVLVSVDTPLSPRN